MKTVAPINNLYEGSWAEDYTPSEETRRKYLYPQCMGYYRTSQNYNVIKRSNLSSYLVIYTVSGQGCIEYKGQKTFLSPNQTVIIDCTLPHSYYNAPECNWGFHWLHFYGSGIEGYLADIIDNWAPVEIPDMDEFFNNIYKNVFRL